MLTPDRQTGRTSRQMLTARKGAVYIVLNNMYYYNMLKHHLKREDIHVRSVEYMLRFDGARLRGEPRVIGAVVLDHYAEDTLTDEYRAAWQEYVERCRP